LYVSPDFVLAEMQAKKKEVAMLAAKLEEEVDLSQLFGDAPELAIAKFVQEQINAGICSKDLSAVMGQYQEMAEKKAS
jgi:hypothetical protein